MKIETLLSSNIGSCLINVVPLFSLIVVSIVVMFAIVIFFITDLVRAHYIGSKALCLVVCFFAGMIFWLGVYSGYDTISFANFTHIVSNSVKMFALSVGKDDLPIAMANSASETNTRLVYVAMYGESIICFGVVSLSILTSVGRSVIAFLGNSHRSFTKKSDQDKAHYKDVIFTDLPYEELDDFLRVRANAKDRIVIILKQDEQLTQRGTELKSAYLSHGYLVKPGPINYNFLKHFFHQKYGSFVRIYSCYKKDDDNLALADEALKLCRNKYWKIFGEEKPQRDPSRYRK